MTDEQFVKDLGKEYLAVLEDAKKLNYEVNMPQFKKLVDICQFFKNYIEANGGSAEEIEMSPEQIHTGITVEFTLFDIFGKEVQDFCDVIKEATALTIDATKSGKVCISITVPDVFKQI